MIPGDRRFQPETVALACVVTATLLGLAACARRAPNSKAETGASSSSPRSTSVSPPLEARWKIIPVFQNPDHGNGQKLLTDEGLVWLDDSGARWLSPPGGAQRARPTPEVETRPLLGRSYAPSLGLLAFTTDRQLLVARPLDAVFVPHSRLPEGSDPQSLRVLGKGIAVRGPSGMLAAVNGATYSAVPGLAGYTMRELLLDEAGNGLGWFVPELVAWTRDRGATWQALSTAGVVVRALEETREGPTIRPGGARDGLGRRVDLTTGAVERVGQPALDDAIAINGAANLARDANATKGEGRMPLWGPTYLAAWGAGSAALPVTDGDDALVVGDDDLSLTRAAPQLRRRLGGWHDGAPHVHLGKLGEPFRVAPGNGSAGGLGCEPRSIALCNGVAAIACPNAIEIFVRGVRQTPIRARPSSAVGFDAEGRLLVASPADERGGAPRVRVGPPDGRPGIEISLGGFADPPTTPLRFTGGCRRPALWLTSQTHAARWDGRAFETTIGLEDASTIIGVNDARDLVHQGTELRFSPSGKAVAAHLDPLFTSFAENGRRGLTRAGAGDLAQTLDGGHTWSPIATPDIPAGTPIVCGATRCQIGNGAFLEGDAPAPPRGATPSAPPNLGPHPSLEADEKTTIAVRCHGAPSLFPAPEDGGPTLYPGLGDALFQLAEPSVLRGDGSTQTPGRWVTGDTKEGATRPARTPRWWQWAGDATLLRHEPRIGHLLGLPQAPASGLTALLTRDTSPRIGDRGDPPRFHLGPGLADADATGKTLVAQEIDPGVLMLGFVDGERIPDPRPLATRLPDPPETGVGLSHEGSGDRTVWLLVDTEDGRTEIRSHALRADLGLGPGTPVPGTQTARGKLLDLPACAVGATGAVLRTQAWKKVAAIATGATTRGWLQRLIRVTPRAACVERTFVSREEGGLASSIVMVGNGGVAMGVEGRPGVRCEMARTGQ